MARSIVRYLLLAVLALGLWGCDEAGVEALNRQDAGLSTTDASISRQDAGAQIDVGSQQQGSGNQDPVRCGPNTCRGAEICCNQACGVCAFADECVDYGCLDGLF